MQTGRPGVPETVGVGVPVTVVVGAAAAPVEGEGLAVKVGSAEAVAVGPTVWDAVGVGVQVAVAEVVGATTAGVVEGVRDGVALLLLLLLLLRRAADGVALGDRLGEAVAVDVPEGDGEREAVLVGRAIVSTGAVGVMVALETVQVGDGVGLVVPEGVGETGLPLPLGVVEGLLVRDRLVLSVGVGVGLPEGAGRHPFVDTRRPTAAHERRGERLPACPPPVTAVEHRHTRPSPRQTGRSNAPPPPRPPPLPPSACPHNPAAQPVRAPGPARARSFDGDALPCFPLRTCLAAEAGGEGVRTRERARASGPNGRATVPIPLFISPPTPVSPPPGLLFSPFHLRLAQPVEGQGNGREWKWGGGG